MALQQVYSDKYGNTYNEAYYRVTGFNLDTITNSTTAFVCVYKDITARNNNKAPLKQYQHVFDSNNGKFTSIFGIISMDNKNPVKGIYDEIKTYPEYSGATSV